MESILLVRKDMSQEKPITLRQVTGSPTSSPQKNYNHARISKPFLHLCEVWRTEELLCLWHQRGRPVSNLIYATMVEDTIENRQKLQELATANDNINLTIQLRGRNGRIVYQTQ